MTVEMVKPLVLMILMLLLAYKPAFFLLHRFMSHTAEEEGKCRWIIEIKES